MAFRDVLASHLRVRIFGGFHRSFQNPISDRIDRSPAESDVSQKRSRISGHSSSGPLTSQTQDGRESCKNRRRLHQAVWCEIVNNRRGISNEVSRRDDPGYGSILSQEDERVHGGQAISALTPINVKYSEIRQRPSFFPRFFLTYLS